MMTKTTLKKRGRKPSIAKEYYINNREFYEELIEYFDNLKKESDISIPECIWLKFHKLTVRISMLPKFSGYTYKEEFMSDAILLCAIKVTKFNPKKSQNPFAFFTQIITNCYWARIAGENKEVNKKKDLLYLYKEDKSEMDSSDKYDISYNNDGKLVFCEPKEPTKEYIKNNSHTVKPIHVGGPKYGF